GQADTWARHTQQPGQCRTADFPRMLAQVFAVGFEEVKAVEEGGPRAAAFRQGVAQALEGRHPAVVTDDTLAIDRRGAFTTVSLRPGACAAVRASRVCGSATGLFGFTSSAID